LLEVSWEALQRAGIAVRREDRLDGGVFVGLMAAEYADRMAAGPLNRIDPYYGTGGGHCFAAGRISYALGLRGPAVSIDTACSSSLVALHMAARSVRSRECRFALVGGANLLFSPQLLVSLCQSRALAPDGRCKPFTAAADGYGRGEGVAVAVLMRLDDAMQEGRPVLAVLRGTAVNHDGAASGLTVPSGPAQQEVIRAALHEAGIAPDEVSYIEAHGTGTSLGDPIEAAGLAAVFGPGRPETAGPVIVGSVKARLGHLEAAAGIAGLVKVVLMLQHEEILADLRETDGALNPLIPWATNRLEVPRRARPWTGAGRVAGISAFGLSGTNAHAVLQAAPPAPAEPVAPQPRPELLVLSARTIPALHALAAVVSTYLFRANGAQLSSACHTLRAGRAPMACRVAVTGSSTAELARKVSIAAAQAPPPPATPARSVVLSTASPVPDSLRGGVAAIASDLPVLAALAGPLDGDPGEWLVSAFEALGVTATARAGTGPSAPPAVAEFGGRRVTLVPDDAGRASEAFLEALAALFLAGADMRLGLLSAPGARFLADLPTYRFQRRRFWIDEVAGERHAPAASAGWAPHGPPAAARGSQEPAAADGAGDVEHFLRAELAAVLKLDDEPDLGLSFAEIGGDSFMAMLFLKGVQDRYPAVSLADEFAVDQPLSDLLGALARDIAAGAGTARGTGE
jgi:acyl transferase domain-containing protein